MRALLAALLVAAPALAQVFSPSQEAELRLKYLQSTGGISGTLVIPGSLPADRVVGTGVTFATYAAGDITGAFARLYFNSRAEPRLQGLVLGVATSRTPGAIRFDTGSGEFQGYGYSGWAALGGGDTFPLEADADAAGFSITNGNVFGAARGLFNVLGTDSSPPPFTTLIYTNGGYTHQYGVRYVTNYTDWVTQQAVSTNLNLYPGQLVYSPDGNTYYANSTIYGALYQPNTTNALPYPGTSTNFTLFVAKGAAGSAGASGTYVINYASNFNWGVWGSSIGYGTNVETVVQYGSRWWHAIRGSTNVPPGSNTNYWEISVDKGDDGSLIGTNLVLRGNWNAVDSYVSNEVVAYGGNMFYIYTNMPGANHTPSLGSGGIGADNAYWNVLVSRGEQGAIGAAGADGAVTFVTNLFNAYLLDESASVLNTPASNDVLEFVQQRGSVPFHTNDYRWRWAPKGISLSTGSSNSVSTNASGVVAIVVNTNYSTVESDPIFTNWLASTPPLYVETDPVWASASNAIWQAIVSLTTGGAITVESDPVFSASEFYTNSAAAIIAAALATEQPYCYVYGTRANTNNVTSGAFVTITNMPNERVDASGLWNPTNALLTLTEGEWAVEAGSYIGGTATWVWRICGTNGLDIPTVATNAQFTAAIQANGRSAYFAGTGISADGEKRMFFVTITGATEVCRLQIRFVTSGQIDAFSLKALRLRSSR